MSETSSYDANHTPQMIGLRVLRLIEETELMERNLVIATGGPEHTSRWTPAAFQQAIEYRRNAINEIIRGIGGLPATVHSDGEPPLQVQLISWLGRDPENKNNHHWYISQPRAGKVSLDASVLQEIHATLQLESNTQPGV